MYAFADATRVAVAAACPTVVFPFSSIFTLTVASANAYINSLNKMIIKREKTATLEQESQKVRGI